MQFHYTLLLFTLVKILFESLHYSILSPILRWDFMHLIYLLGFRYWLYATVKLGCLLVTNDEMRDHIFELLGSNFFNQWKERHQVRYFLFLRLLILASARSCCLLTTKKVLPFNFKFSDIFLHLPSFEIGYSSIKEFLSCRNIIHIFY